MLDHDNRKSQAPYSHRVVSDEPTTKAIVPCRLCGAVGEIIHRPERINGWVIMCPRRNHTKGTRSQENDTCANTKQHLRTTLAGAISSWNKFNDPSYVPKSPRNKRNNYDAQKDIDSKGPTCPKCFLMITSPDGECIDCPGRKDAVASPAGTRVGEQRTSAIMTGGPR